MMGYKDRTWCVSTDCRLFNTCDRALTDAVKEAAIKWWGNSSAPFTQSNQFECFEPLSKEED